MGLLKKYLFDQDKIIYKLVISNTKKELYFLADLDLYDYKKEYERLRIDLFAASDVPYMYKNGNNSKDEWQRYYKHDFTNVKLVNKNQTYKNFEITYSFDQFVNTSYSQTDPESVTNVPFGKFKNMTYEQYLEYRKQNIFSGFRGVR